MGRLWVGVLLFWTGLCGCGWSRTGPNAPLDQQSYDVVVVPGCPCNTDGRLSQCQWRRAAWAAMLYNTGAVDSFITSGAAAYTPHIEAVALRKGMVALGVPHEIIHTETGKVSVQIPVSFLVINN